jgi:hypothetical protein
MTQKEENQEPEETLQLDCFHCAWLNNYWLRAVNPTDSSETRCL